jgi:hypothetical protein
MTGWPLVRATDSAMCSRQIGKPGQLSIGFDQIPSIQQSAQPGWGAGSVMLMSFQCREILAFKSAGQMFEFGVLAFVVRSDHSQSCGLPRRRFLSRLHGVLSLSQGHFAARCDSEIEIFGPLIDLALARVKSRLAIVQNDGGGFRGGMQPPGIGCRCGPLPFCASLRR